jgi:hypothetical protein
VDELFSSGLAIEAVLGVLALEALVLGVLLRAQRVVPMAALLSGAGLLLAWRLQQAGVHWSWVGAALSAAGVAHAWDLWQRWMHR